MKTQRISRKFVISSSALSVLILAGCGQPQPQNNGDAFGSNEPTAAMEPVPSKDASSRQTSLPVASAAGPTSSQQAPSESSPPQSAPSEAAPPPVIHSELPNDPTFCQSNDLIAATHVAGGGAAGSVYMSLRLTNIGTSTCLVSGYPGVSLTMGPDGSPIGAPAVRDRESPVTQVVLSPGQTGAAVLRYTHAANYLGCTQTHASGYRIYPPENTASLFIPQPTKACRNTSIKLLSIGPFRMP